VSIGILIGNQYGRHRPDRTRRAHRGQIGLGLGFGLQAIASNFVSGFVLLMDKSIKPGRRHQLHRPHRHQHGKTSAGYRSCAVRFVVVRDRDGVDTLVPNQESELTNSVINWSYTGSARAHTTAGHDQLRGRSGGRVAGAHGGRPSHHPRILKEPHPVTRLMSFEDHGMRLGSAASGLPDPD